MYRRYWLVFAILILVTPLGLLAEGTAWGEWGSDDLSAVLGYVPQGIAQADSWWKAAFPDYSVKFLGQGLMADQLGYIISAALGSVLIYAAVLVYGRIVAKTNIK